jgi:predicted metal-dependent hydrolase
MKKKESFKEVVIKVDKLPQQVLEQIAEIAEKNAELVCSNRLDLLTKELRREITDLKNELYKKNAIPGYARSYEKYTNFEDEKIVEHFNHLVDRLSVEFGRAPRAIRIRIKNLGLLGI